MQVLWGTLVTTTIVGAGSMAAAQPVTIESELRELASAPDRGRGFHAAAFAQLAGGSSAGGDPATVDGDAGPTATPEGTLAVGGDTFYRGERCDYLRVGGQARLSYRDSLRPSAEQWASFCIPIFVMEFGHHLEWDVRAALLAPLGMRAGANRRETVSFRWQPLRMRLGYLLAGIERGEAKKQGIELTDPIDPEDPVIPGGDGLVFDTRVQGEFLWTAGGSEVAFREIVDTIPFGYARRQRTPWGDEREFTVDIFRAGGEFVDGKGSTVGFWATRIENLKLGPVYATGGVGLVSAAAGEFVEEYERQVDLTTPRALIGIETGGRVLHGHVRGTHDATIVADGYVTVDSRVTAGIGWRAGERTEIDVDGAIAKTKVYVPGVPRAVGATGGGSLALRHHLAARLDATLQLDVARSFYAASAMSLDFVPRWGVYGFAALQARIGR